MLTLRSLRANGTYLRVNLTDVATELVGGEVAEYVSPCFSPLRANLGRVEETAPPTSPIPTDGLVSWFQHQGGYSLTPFLYGSDNTVSTEFTIIGLARIDGTSTYPGAAYGLFAANDEIRWCCTSSTSGRVSFVLYDNAYVPNSTGIYFDSVSTSTYYCWTWRFKSGDSNIIRQNGVQVHSNIYTQDFSATKDINIRATVINNSQYHFNGRIKAVLAWNRKLTDAEMVAVEDYLMELP